MNKTFVKKITFPLFIFGTLLAPTTFAMEEHQPKQTTPPTNAESKLELTLDSSEELPTLIQKLKNLSISHPKLTSLALFIWNDSSEEKIGTAGVETIIKYLPSNLKSLTLDLQNNNIGTAGALALAKAFSATIEELNLNIGDNNIKALGAQTLVKNFPQGLKQSMLNLGGNNLGTLGVQSVLDLIPTNLQTLVLYFDKKDIGDAEQEFLEKLSETHENWTIALCP